MKRVLVVDDEPDIRTIVSQVLRDAGYTAVVAANVRPDFPLAPLTGNFVLPLHNSLRGG